MSKQQTNLESQVLDYLAVSKKERSRCLTCRLENEPEITEACLVFNKAREAKQTNLTWAHYTEGFLAPKLGFPLDYRAAIRHLEKCIGQKTY